MSEKHSYSFLLEYIAVIVMFVVCATICISVFTGAYKKNEVANITKKALEEATLYIETGDYTNRNFSIDEVTYKVEEHDKEHKQLKIIATYENKELFDLVFYGGDYE